MEKLTISVHVWISWYLFMFQGQYLQIGLLVQTNRMDQCYLRGITQSKCWWLIATGDKEYNNMKDKCKIMYPWEQWHHWWKTNANIVPGNIPCHAFLCGNTSNFIDSSIQDWSLSCWKITITCTNCQSTNDHTTFFAYVFFFYKPSSH